MSGLLAELDEIADQHLFNRERWKQVQEDPFLATLEHRIETDRFGAIVIFPPPGFQHSDLQSLILEKLRETMPDKGRALAECPVSTNGGVKGIDAVWISNERVAGALKDNLLVIAPEICVEVLSPGNTRAEILEKKRLYFEAGADEVWICGKSGEISFFQEDGPIPKSNLCGDFPTQLESKWG
jgi:Uma2 family endonuclease